MRSSTREKSLFPSFYQRQHKDYWCVPASVSMLLDYQFEDWFSQEELARLFNTDRSGTDFKDLSRGLRYIDYKLTRVSRKAAIKMLLPKISSRLLVCYNDSKQGSHCAVALWCTQNENSKYPNVVIDDPYYGHLTIPMPVLELLEVSFYQITPLP